MALPVDPQADHDDRSGAPRLPIDEPQQYYPPNRKHRDTPGGTPDVEEHSCRHMAGLDPRQCRAMDGDCDGNTHGILFME